MWEGWYDLCHVVCRRPRHVVPLRYVHPASSDGAVSGVTRGTCCFGVSNSLSLLKVYERYEKELQRSNGLDFDDLLLRVVALLR